MSTRQSRKRKGFILAFIIIILPLIGAEMFVLGRGSYLIMFQADHAFLQASEKNLINSGLAWAQKNAQSENVDIFNKITELPIPLVNCSSTTLRVTVEKSDNAQPPVKLESSCTRGRQTFNHRKTYLLEP